ncbi:hypothetical protein [Luteimonas terrae]|uniref:Uncharacterized protein n=1 Tax=Luteimonas terrae TaxID=1530191 RepID=A0ABU1XX64_9GAMM|nr:hypothetical protein [Luteimonas terrae]MDR7193350.1 hypothetical protein [Luteimonas terrae]
MTSTPTKPPRASRATPPADQVVDANKMIAAAPVEPTVRVVLPVGARPGLLRVGDYVPGVTYAVTPASAERLRARGFQIAADVTDTAHSATADGAGGGSTTQES